MRKIHETPVAEGVLKTTGSSDEGKMSVVPCLFSAVPDEDDPDEDPTTETDDAAAWPSDGRLDAYRSSAPRPTFR
jgi:hypothetical protein